MDECRPILRRSSRVCGQDDETAPQLNNPTRTERRPLNATRTVAKKIRRPLGSIKRDFQARREALAKIRALDGKSSITNQRPYLDFCAQAAADDQVFESFRLKPVYVSMLEHVSESQGAGYLAAIQRDNPGYLGERLEALRGNDRLGLPLLYEYPGIGRISPVTLRYMKVLSDLELLFGDLTGKRVIEIGVGYGGQARLGS
jgi:hypothetical protein